MKRPFADCSYGMPVVPCTRVWGRVERVQSQCAEQKQTTVGRNRQSDRREVRDSQSLCSTIHPNYSRPDYGRNHSHSPLTSSYTRSYAHTHTGCSRSRRRPFVQPVNRVFASKHLRRLSDCPPYRQPGSSSTLGDTVGRQFCHCDCRASRAKKREKGVRGRCTDRRLFSSLALSVPQPN